MNTLTANTSKPRFETLDALRGVAALIVIWYHVGEGFATSPIDQWFNHGHLAVDFFFMLSGFVIGYAYDDRWNAGGLTTWQFFKRRLVRLHPMVAMGVLLGAIAFIAGGCKQWDGTVMTLTMVIAACCLNLFMLPVLPGNGADVRGNGEMFPLNGPHWSLFFEYIANVLYALFVRRLSTLGLVILTAIGGIALAWTGIGNASGYGHLGMGWTLADNNLWGGFARLMFSFTAGLLMSRVIIGKLRHRIKGALLWCALIMVATMAVPHVGGAEHLWLNGLYESVVVIIVFPIVLYMGASAQESKRAKLTGFLGKISYPVYAIHYPMMYLFYAWVWANELTFSDVWHVAVGIFFSSIILAWILLKWYDEPVRKYLAARFINHKK